MVEEGFIDLKLENAMSPTGIQGNRVILNLGHSRMRTRYWRQLNDGSWVQTQLLPADPQSINIYFSKGFRARPPEEVRSIRSEILLCPYPGCGYEAKGDFGLRSHMKKHQKKSLGEGQFS